jgi:hypothetical protein
MSDVFERIAKAVCEIVSGVNLPFISRSVMSSVFDSVGHSIPHVGVTAREVHLHS